MALAVRQVKTSTRSSGTTIANTFAAPVLAGSLLVACVSMFEDQSVTPTIADSVNGAWASYTTSGYLITDSGGYLICFSFPNSAAGTPTVTFTSGSAGSDNDLTLFEITGAATSSPRDVSVPATATYNGTTGGTTAVVSGTLAQADEILISALSHNWSNTTLTEDTADSFTKADENESNTSGQTFLVQYKIVSATTSVTVNGTIGTTADAGTPTWIAVVASFKAGSFDTWEQEGYRWRNDDGSETTATWVAAQDTGMTAPTGENRRLRMLIDTAGADPATQALRLEYKEDSESAAFWRPVGLVALGAMPAYDGTGQAAAVVSATITTAITPAKPSTVNAGDLLILQVMHRNDDNNGAGPATITDWTAFAGNPYGGTNNSRQSLYWRIAGAGEASQTVSVTCTGGTTNDLAMARIYRFTAANGFRATPIEDIQVNAGTASPMAAPANVTPTGTNRRAVCLGAIASSDATIGDMTGESAGNWVEAATGNTTTGGDGTLNVQTADASAGTAISGGSIAFTTSTSAHWNTVAFCLVPAANAIIMSASANITASGENTTAQLTAPASGSFGGGRLQDDEVTADTIDLALNDYGEWEWCLQATASAVAADVYQFRVTRAGTVLDTYTVTPTWTIGTAAGPLTVSVAEVVGIAE